MKRLIKETVRKLRRRQTNAELILWQAIRNRKVCGRKFLRQHPIVFEWDRKKRFLIADFYCSEAKLVVEVDGGIHERQRDYDEAREYALKCLGLKVVRFINKDIVKDFEVVFGELKDICDSPPDALSKLTL